MEKDKIKIIDGMIVVITILVLAGSLGYIGYLSPLVISPSDDFETTETSVLFSFENADTIWIDDNMNFTSPEKITVKDNIVVKLAPGTYYWKIEGLWENEIRKFTILSQVELKLKSSGEYYEVVNSGNTLLDVEVYDNESLTSKMQLKVDESKNVSGTKFIGGMSNE